MSDTHVVVGATGALGAAVVRRLVELGRPTRAFVRDEAYARALLPAEAQLVAGDAMHRDDVIAACTGAGVIFHCLNVPYRDWQAVMPAVTTHVMAGAQEAGARLVFPGNVYGLGRFKRIPAPEHHPRNATTHKGKIRNFLEQTLLYAHRSGQVPVVIPRFPDFYGPNVTNELYGKLFEAALEGRRARWVGRLDVPHDLVFIDDAAAACVLLADSEAAWGGDWNVPGAGPLAGRRFLEMIFAAAGRKPRIASIPGWMLRVAGLFSDDAREVAEIGYLFTQPQVLDGSKLAAAFPDFRFTPHDEAIARTLAWFRTRPQR